MTMKKVSKRINLTLILTDVTGIFWYTISIFETADRELVGLEILLLG